ncbi:MAG TPA: hypothetical protein PLR07_14415 [Promineifilum sp.]|nr:hypothetical protein [Promineifilum sp.]
MINQESGIRNQESCELRVTSEDEVQKYEMRSSFVTRHYGKQ